MSIACNVVRYISSSYPRQPRHIPLAKAFIDCWCENMKDIFASLHACCAFYNQPNQFAEESVDDTRGYEKKGSETNLKLMVHDVALCLKI